MLTLFNKKFLIVYFVFSGLFQGLSQPFILVENYSQQMLQISSGCAIWADYNLDKKPDVFVSGIQDEEYVSALYRNTGNGLEVVNFDFLPLGYCHASWNDFDNDNDPDLFLMGVDMNDEIQCRLYRNMGNDVFEETDPGIIGVRNGSSCWGDLDNDGWQDLILVGQKGEEGVTRIYRNLGNGQFSIVDNALMQVFEGDVDLGDYNMDHYLDVLLIGKYIDEDGLEQRTLNLFRNEGDFQFTPISSGFIGMSESNVRWGDYDADGDLDILANGSTDAPTHLVYLYQNLGSDNFMNIGIEIFGTVNGSVSWGDYDNDGDLDFLLTGKPSYSSEPITVIYRNIAENLFNQEPNQNISSVYESSSSWCDYDHDGDLDVLITGIPDATSPGISRLFENENILVNQIPSVPQGLSQSVNSFEVVLSWLPSSDPETQVENLTYNLRIGSSPGGHDILSPLSLATGERLKWSWGNAGLSTSILLNIMQAGTYYWNVQAVDNNFEPSAFSETSSFVVNPVSVNSESISKQNRLSVFPNPFKDKITITIKGHDESSYELQIFDISGIHVQTIQLSAGLFGNALIQWDGRDWNQIELHKGIYWIILIDKKNKRIADKVKVLKLNTD